MTSEVENIGMYFLFYTILTNILGRAQNEQMCMYIIFWLILTRSVIVSCTSSASQPRNLYGMFFWNIINILMFVLDRENENFERMYFFFGLIIIRECFKWCFHMCIIWTTTIRKQQWKFWPTRKFVGSK